MNITEINQQNFKSIVETEFKENSYIFACCKKDKCCKKYKRKGKACKKCPKFP